MTLSPPCPMPAEGQLTELRRALFAAREERDLCQALVLADGATLRHFRREVAGASERIPALLRQHTREAQAFHHKLQRLEDELARLGDLLADLPRPALESQMAAARACLQALIAAPEPEGDGLLPVIAQIDSLLNTLRLACPTYAHTPFVDEDAADSASDAPVRRPGRLETALVQLGTQLGAEYRRELRVHTRGLELIPPSWESALFDVSSQLLRNATEFGIEAPEQRIAAGKPARRHDRDRVAGVGVRWVRVQLPRRWPGARCRSHPRGGGAARFDRRRSGAARRTTRGHADLPSRPVDGHGARGPRPWHADRPRSDPPPRRPDPNRGEEGSLYLAVRRSARGPRPTRHRPRLDTPPRAGVQSSAGATTAVHILDTTSSHHQRRCTPLSEREARLAPGAHPTPPLPAGPRRDQPARAGRRRYNCGPAGAGLVQLSAAAFAPADDPDARRARPNLIEVGDAFHPAWCAARVARRRGIPLVAFFHSIFAELRRSTDRPARRARHAPLRPRRVRACRSRTDAEPIDVPVPRGHWRAPVTAGGVELLVFASVAPGPRCATTSASRTTSDSSSTRGASRPRRTCRSCAARWRARPGYHLPADRRRHPFAPGSQRHGRTLSAQQRRAGILARVVRCARARRLSETFGLVILESARLRPARRRCGCRRRPRTRR